MDALKKKQAEPYNKSEVVKLMKYYGFKTRESIVRIFEIWAHTVLEITIIYEMNNIFCRLLGNLRMSFLWV